VRTRCYRLLLYEWWDLVLSGNRGTYQTAIIWRCAALDKEAAVELAPTPDDLVWKLYGEHAHSRLVRVGMTSQDARAHITELTPMALEALRDELASYADRGPTMSSLEIAELTGRKHEDVWEEIRRAVVAHIWSAKDSGVPRSFERILYLDKPKMGDPYYCLTWYEWRYLVGKSYSREDTAIVMKRFGELMYAAIKSEEAAAPEAPEAEQATPLLARTAAELIDHDTIKTDDSAPNPASPAHVKTMSSREVAEICSRQHSDVVAGIQREMVAHIRSGRAAADPNYASIYERVTGSLGRPCYNLTMGEWWTLVVFDYPSKDRTAIIRRWSEIYDGEVPAKVEVPEPPVIIDDEGVTGGLRAPEVEASSVPTTITIEGAGVDWGVDAPLRELSLAGYDDDDETPAAFTIVIKNGPMGVDLRELHRELGSKRDFSSWTKEKLKQFVEDEDFVINNRSVVNSGRGRPTIDYAVTADTAKNIALMEQTERGKEVRRYFIECEKELWIREMEASRTAPATLTHPEVLRLAADAIEKNEEQALLLEVRDRQLEEQKPKVQFVDRFVAAPGLYGVRKAAKFLGVTQTVFAAKRPIGAEAGL